jgi:trimeric autotransporter adhesin
MAILGTADGNGRWEYRLAGSADWQAIALGGNALLLGAQDSVRFVPNERAGTTASFTYRAWDTTNAAAPGSLVAIAGTGGTSAFSDQTDTATIAVSDVNDAPVIAPLPDRHSLEDQAFTVTIGELAAAFATDADTPASGLTFTVEIRNGANLLATFTRAATSPDPISFTPPANFNGVLTATVTASDGAETSEAQSFDLIVDPLNDAAAVSGPVTGTAMEDGPPVTLNGLANASDPDSGAVLTVNSRRGRCRPA